jgi:ribosome biogenesis GTPase
MDIEAAVVWNKSDLSAPRPDDLAAYERIGYSIIATSAAAASGLDSLRARLAGKISMLVGQSGVGKSSLINLLVPGAEVAVGEISAATEEGRHTTTASMMHTLPEGGRLIDSPGVRDFQPALDAAADVERGFRELREVAHDCRFSDCRHLREPDCAVREAVADGRISPRRYESYRRVYRSLVST